MGMTLAMHIAAGIAAILAGFVALYSGKGEALHRRAGRVFAYSMLAMCAGGFTLAVVRDAAPATNVPAALLTASLVVTALTTVRPPSATARVLDTVAMFTSLGVGVTMMIFTATALATGESVFGFLIAGTVGLLAARGDLNVLRHGRREGSARLARHLWRMCFALFVATLSLFLGQADVFPQTIRATGLLPVPVLAVVLTMFYWLWRTRRRRNAPLVLNRKPEPV